MQNVNRCEGGDVFSGVLRETLLFACFKQLPL